MDVIGKSIPRIEAEDKVTGRAKYTADFSSPGMLHAKLLTSPHAHARIVKIDTTEAKKAPGVRAIVTGQDIPIRVGPHIQGRPLLAIEKVRHHGEPVALVVADSEYQAKAACKMIKVEYEAIPMVLSAADALKVNPSLVHPNLASYSKDNKVHPEINTNVANRTKIRKGSMEDGWKQSEIIVESSFFFPQSDHAAMETRCATAEIFPNGVVEILTASQAPYDVKKLIHDHFFVPLEKVHVKVPLVGGGFGGKAAVQLELLAYIASRAVNGKKVKLANSREEDFMTSPTHIGLDAKVKMGATKTGQIMAAEITFYFIGGAYSDEGVDISKAAALNCTGPYKIDNVWCDSLCLFTNHTYATSFRGYAHIELTFPIERTIDLMAQKLQMDPIDFRLKNVIRPGDTTPSCAELTQSNIGDVFQCLNRAKALIHWEEGQKTVVENERIKVKGVSCFWKTSTSSTNASSGAVITFNKDGSINLSCGVVEIGQGTKTTLAQILAQRFKMDMGKIHVMMDVNTEVNPEHWKTVASSSTYMVGNAVLRAAEDAIQQICRLASSVLLCNPEDIDVAEGKAYLKSNPKKSLYLKDLVHGYQYQNGNAIGGQVIGRGSFIMRHLTHIDPSTGKGIPGPSWTVGAQAVEVIFDPKTYTYELKKAVSVIDLGKVLNLMGATGQVMGGMSMGLGFATREGFTYNGEGQVLDTQFRTYKMMRYGEQPEYVVEFIETPQIDGPYGARGVGEHGTIGIAPALANALSLAVEVPLNKLPLTPETIWQTKRGESNDSL
ncbi:xanthine dehydrogenase family protein molybdopterin-binding subunit [Ammoniphilus resinae]|uniref:CO/xanthine dehydrogenase Mo-binding subunit n=1 Tax=Ammoniphilus resinae TaxID=861532 RepID=A0ABS4GXD2_9BACL|nr:xanthine dehydrogenase family protein molybdopterin-binding subunit [Ammoniphilus resinae]MBP1934911.1 CO/xanthine dehydrogenase Mo-binding subunit [Ammoniphilus resinae]